MTLAERIREARDSAGLSNAALARATGLTSSAVAQWLDGTVLSLKGTTAARLERATGYRATWLATGLGARRVDEPQQNLDLDGAGALATVVKCLDLIIDPVTRSNTRALLALYLEDPEGNADLRQVVVNRLTLAEPNEPLKSALAPDSLSSRAFSPAKSAQ